MDTPLQHFQQSELDPIVDLEKKILKFYSNETRDRNKTLLLSKTKLIINELTH